MIIFYLAALPFALLTVCLLYGLALMMFEAVFEFIEANAQVVKWATASIIIVAVVITVSVGHNA